MSEKNNSLNFDDLEVIERPFKYKGKRYLLREASESASRAYQNCIFRATKPNADGKPTSMEGFADRESILLSKCLFEIYEAHGNQAERPVPIQIIEAWPRRMTKQLFEQCVKDSGLDNIDSEELLEKRIKEDTERLTQLKNGSAEDPLKNSSHATEDISVLATS